jgi:hypothetical protein
VGGDSAGGNLAAVMALLARDRRGPRILLQVLVYPVTNHDFGAQSYVENATGYLLTTEDMRWFWRHYLSREEQGQEVTASPMRAKSLADLPPALVMTAGCDPLRDEGDAYAARLRHAVSRHVPRLHAHDSHPRSGPRGSRRGGDRAAQGPGLTLSLSLPGRGQGEALQQEGHPRGLHDRAELRHQVVGDRHTLLEPLRAREALGIAGHQHRLRRIGALGAVQHVDHVVEVALELARIAEGARIDRCAPAPPARSPCGHRGRACRPAG